MQGMPPAGALSDAARPARSTGRRWSPRRASPGWTRIPAVQRQMAAAEDRALQTALLSKEVGPQVTEEAVRARYDQEIAGKPGEEEVHARHILVADRGRGEEDHRRSSRRAPTSPRSRSSTARTPAARSRAAISASSRRATWCRNSPTPPSRCSRARSRRRRCTPVRLACHPGGGAQARRAADLRAGARRAAPEDDPGGRAEGAATGAQRRRRSRSSISTARRPARPTRPTAARPRPSSTPAI